ncbi:hypothetical protein [Mycoplasmopsis californica]|nr:hypothetical protein [Mycoplasmopsis californica]
MSGKKATIENKKVSVIDQYIFSRWAVKNSQAIIDKMVQINTKEKIRATKLLCEKIDKGINIASNITTNKIPGIILFTKNLFIK